MSHYHEMTIDSTFRHATLPAREASAVVAAHPELAGRQSDEPIVVAVTVSTHDEAAALTDFLTAAGSALTRRTTASRQVLRALLPADQMPVGPGVLMQVRRNAEARADLAREFGLLTSAEVARSAASRAANVSALASRWRREGLIFSVETEAGTSYPGYQFDDVGRPRAVIARVVAVLSDVLSAWELALWFVSSNSWLGGARPVDVLQAHPDEVVEAGLRLAEELAV